MFYNDVIKEKAYAVNFSSRKIEPEKIETIVRAGQNAPTAKGASPQRIMLVDELSALNKLSLCTTSYCNAPVALLVGYDKHLSWKRPEDHKDYGLSDVNIVAVHMTLAIYNFGLGTNIVKGFNRSEIRLMLGVPHNIIPVIIMYVGYPTYGSYMSIMPEHEQTHLLL